MSITQTLEREPRWPDLEYVSLELPGISYVFNLSVENTLEDEWIYRIHHLADLKIFRQITKDAYEGFRNNLRITAQAFNDNDMISAQSRVQKLMTQWQKIFSA